MKSAENAERTPVAEPPEWSPIDHLRGQVAALRKHSPSWPTPRRIRALQELLREVSDVVEFAIDELEGVRSGSRFSQRAKS